MLLLQQFSAQQQEHSGCMTIKHTTTMDRVKRKFTSKCGHVENCNYIFHCVLTKTFVVAVYFCFFVKWLIHSDLCFTTMFIQQLYFTSRMFIDSRLPTFHHNSTRVRHCITPESATNARPTELTISNLFIVYLDQSDA